MDGNGFFFYSPVMKSRLKSPVFYYGIVLGLSLSALAAAFASEAFLGLEPCVLCIYQRYPYAFAALFSLIGLLLRKRRRLASALLGLCALLFLGNNTIAVYHTGVELHWWESAVESCTIFQFKNENQSVLENILSAPLGRCDEIPWKDPILGLSMANYNVALCLILSLFCLYGAVRVRKYPEGSLPS